MVENIHLAKLFHDKMYNCIRHSLIRTYPSPSCLATSFVEQCKRFVFHQEKIYVGTDVNREYFPSLKLIERQQLYHLNSNTIDISDYHPILYRSKKFHFFKIFLDVIKNF